MSLLTVSSLQGTPLSFAAHAPTHHTERHEEHEGEEGQEHVEEEVVGCSHKEQHGVHDTDEQKHLQGK